MPNVIQHYSWPTVWALLVGAALFGVTPFILALAVICGLPMGFYSALPDLYGVWKGSTPGFSPFPDPKKGDWTGYVSSHHGEYMEKHKKNPFYAFHLWQDLYSHGNPDYVLVKNQPFWWDLINDVLIVVLLVALGGIVFALEFLVAVSASLYVFKLISWAKNELGRHAP